MLDKLIYKLTEMTKSGDLKWMRHFTSYRTFHNGTKFDLEKRDAMDKPIHHIYVDGKPFLGGESLYRQVERLVRGEEEKQTNCFLSSILEKLGA